MGVGTYYGVQYSKAYVADPPTMIHASYFGKTFTMVDTVEVGTDLTLDSKFTMFRPPKGARWTGLGKLWADDQTAAHLAVGTGITAAAVAAVVDKFLPATDAHTSGPIVANLGAATEIDAVGYEFDGSTNVIITSSAGDLATATTITLMMEFVMA